MCPDLREWSAPWSPCTGHAVVSVYALVCFAICMSRLYLKKEALVVGSMRQRGHKFFIWKLCPQILVLSTCAVLSAWSAGLFAPSLESPTPPDWTAFYIAEAVIFSCSLYLACCNFSIDTTRLHVYTMASNSLLLLGSTTVAFNSVSFPISSGDDVIITYSSMMLFLVSTGVTFLASRGGTSGAADELLG